MPRRVVESYVARRNFDIGDRHVTIGEPVPEAEEWRNPQHWVDAGYLGIVYVEFEAEPVPEVAVEEAGEMAAEASLEDLNVGDLRAEAKVRGLTGYSKLRKDKLLVLLAG